jgi:hypothetical protein
MDNLLSRKPSTALTRICALGFVSLIFYSIAVGSVGEARSWMLVLAEAFEKNIWLCALYGLPTMK